MKWGMGDGDTSSRVRNLGTGRRQVVSSVNRRCVGDRKAGHTSVPQPFSHLGTPDIVFHIPRSPYLEKTFTNLKKIVNCRAKISAIFRGIFKDFSRYFKSFYLLYEFFLNIGWETLQNTLANVCTCIYIYVCVCVCTYVQGGREVTVHPENTHLRLNIHFKLIWWWSLIKQFPERSNHLGHGLSRVLSLVHPHTCHQALLDRVTACVSH